MLFFVLCGAMALMVTAMLVLPLLRPRESDAGASEVAVYKAQLDEVDRDVAQGVLDPAEAERARTEIARRLLSADKADAGPTAPAPVGLSRTAAALSAVLVLGATGVGYTLLGAFGPAGPYPDVPRADRIANADAMRDGRPSQAELESVAGRMTLAPENVPEDYLEMVAQLREVVPTRPDEVEGWVLLARHEAALGNFSAAARAEEQVVALRGEEVTLQERERLVDLLVAAAGGVVSPEVEARVQELLEDDPGNLAGRYYLGLLYAQTDRPDVGFGLWREVLDSGGDGPYVRLARGQIEEAAFRAGEEYRLPPQRGPTEADMAAAAEMDPEARAAMIANMVAGLEDRLATDGGTAEDWARLITAKTVLGDTAQAQAILTEARQVFAGRAEDLAQIDRAAAQAGLE
ncbi:hypothetical protein ROA7023_02524 [Roseisalinus antarcticus]|uniref:Cytochrome c-type biogenesis protein CcmH n=2 Tax=Roseisalinus antarcticus TaxID=254357 RepID=A0A1Y5T7E0_9RHOB|nr:hypothetical protein ROA7023_02524 [Roseisalinus antarcticus]